MENQFASLTPKQWRTQSSGANSGPVPDTSLTNAEDAGVSLHGSHARLSPALGFQIRREFVTQLAFGHASISRTARPRIHSLSLADKLSAQRMQKRDSA